MTDVTLREMWHRIWPDHKPSTLKKEAKAELEAQEHVAEEVRSDFLNQLRQLEHAIARETRNGSGRNRRN